MFENARLATRIYNKEKEKKENEVKENV